MNNEEGLFISWVKHHGRSQDLALALGMLPVFIEGGAGPLPIRYAIQSIKTIRMVLEKRPPVMAIMLPPLPLLIVVKLFFRGRLIVDLHSGVFLDPKWKWALIPTLRLIGRKAIAIVTNSALQSVCQTHDVKAIVLHDLISSPTGSSIKTRDRTFPSFILTPLSYANDEPVDEILGAAALDPSLNWVLTGKAPEVVKMKATDNVTFSGYVTDSGYADLLQDCAIVVALTDRPHTMQRGGYEAMIYGKPLVTSEFPELQRFFGDAAMYVPTTATGILGGVRAATTSAEETSKLMRQLQVKHVADQKESVASLIRWVKELSEVHRP
ncbi:glycosyltransferase [Rhodococcus sp. H36-A4]|uniref:glycosyltransferase n=1 Tax=Rhodococcus sp. H36-A4 TaxID=3004353 RepID=UPI0022AEAB3E|nr:glycosyltransferase [Rhodococcus sp. H36-A4]MCZ4076992.1 glycosyltransferase [Rhodococcus sp. H36-A4]